MPGLNFQTCTIINSNVDPDSSVKAKVKVEGEVTDVPNQWLFQSIGEGDAATFMVKRDFRFTKSNICSVYHKKAKAQTPCKATIDFSEIVTEKPTKNEYYRLDLVLGVEGAEPYIYSNAFIQKGIPFWVEFVVTPSNWESVAKVVAESIRKNHLFRVDKDLIDVEFDGNTLVLTGNTEFQRFREISVHKYDQVSEFSEPVAEMDEQATEGAIVLNNRGTNGFGTYAHIVKDLRLPTAANYQWTHIRQVETPIIGAMYDQYIITICAPAANDGFAAVGHRMESTTTHVFWVKTDVSESFMQGLQSVASDKFNEVDAETVESQVEPQVENTEEVVSE